jgi:2-dehydro-3-deoxyglucarate aldolase
MMNRLKKIRIIRKKLGEGGFSIGSWMQIPSPSVAEIMGQAGYDWVAVDLEHGAISIQQLPDLFRALELGDTLPLARLAQGHPKDCKQALDAGAGGVIIPMVESAEQLEMVRSACQWPPAGNRGVAFSRANLFGKYFDEYVAEAKQPLLVAMIEHINAIENLDSILKVNGLDAILIGPYDLSASMSLTSKFDHPDFLAIINQIRQASEDASIPCGIHVVQPSAEEINQKLADGYRFIAYSIDAVILNKNVIIPKIVDK